MANSLTVREFFRVCGRLFNQVRLMLYAVFSIIQWVDEITQGCFGKISAALRVGFGLWESLLHGSIFYENASGPK